MLRHALASILLLTSTALFAGDDIYVSKEKDQYDTKEEGLFDGKLENFALQINLASYHPGNSSEYNQFNRGIGIEYHLDSFFLAGGYFWNSLYRDSFYLGAGKEFTFGDVKWVGIGAIGGLITGYDNGQEPRQALIPYIFFTKDQYTLKVHYLPEIGEVQDDAFGFALRIKFN
jgi:hypothetical protein